MDCKILTFEATKILLLVLPKTGQLHFTRSHLYENVQNGGVSLDSDHSSRQVGYFKKKFRSFAIVKHIRK